MSENTSTPPEYVAHNAAQGQFVRIDLDAKGVKAAYKAANLVGVGGDYGVWYETTADGDAVVRLRDDTHGFVTVPVAALSHSEAGHR